MNYCPGPWGLDENGCTIPCCCWGCVVEAGRRERENSDCGLTINLTEEHWLRRAIDAIVHERILVPDTTGLIQEYGDQAYHKAVQFLQIALCLNDASGAEHFTACARELLQMGYDKHPKKEETPGG